MIMECNQLENSIELFLKMVHIYFLNGQMRVAPMYSIYTPFPESRSLMPSVFNSNFLIFPDGVLG